MRCFLGIKASIFLTLCVSLLCGARTLAEDEAAASTGAVDAVLVLDGSGSMLLTDPLMLRLQGARLFSQFLGKDDRLAVIGFSNTAKVVRKLEPYDPQKAQEIASLVESVGTSGTFTDLTAGITAAVEVLTESPRENARRVIVLLSDGKMEPDPAVGTAGVRTAELVDRILPDLKARETKVYTLAFSEQADNALLSEISGSTDGLNWFTPTADKIHESFANLFLAVKQPQVVPLTSKGFRIDEDIDEATFYINKEDSPNLVIVAPSGEQITAATVRDDIRWFNGQKFDVVTVTAPPAGDWQVKGVASSDGFATVLTDLKLVTEWPSVVRAGETKALQARLYDAEKPVALREMSGVVKFGFQIVPTDKVSEPILREALTDDGTTGDKVEGDGVFSRDVSIAEPGEYKLFVVAKGPTFQRQQQIPFRVKPELVKLFIEKGEAAHDAHGGEHHGEAPANEHKSEEHAAPAGHESDRHEGSDHGNESKTPAAADPKRPVVGGPEDRFVVEVSAEAASLKDLKVALEARDAKKRRLELPLKKDPDDPSRFTFPSAGLPEDGLYLVEAKVEGEGKKREKIEAETPVLRYRRASDPSSEKTVDVKVIETDEATVKIHLGEEGQEEKHEETESPWPYVGGVSLINAALLIVGLSLIKKMQSGVAQTVTEYTVPAAVSELIAHLEERVAMTALDPNDPIFQSVLQDDGSGDFAPEPASEEPSEAPAEEPDSADASAEPTGEEPKEEEQ